MGVWRWSARGVGVVCVLFGRDVVRVRSEMSGSGWPAAASALARAAKKNFFELFLDLENFSEKFLKKV